MVPTSDYYPDRSYIFAFLLSARLFIRPYKLLEKICQLCKEQQNLNCVLEAVTEITANDKCNLDFENSFNTNTLNSKNNINNSNSNNKSNNSSSNNNSSSGLNIKCDLRYCYRHNYDDTINDGEGSEYYKKLKNLHSILFNYLLNG